MRNPDSSNSDRLNVLIYTSLFPNSVRPLLGNFVMERMKYVRQLADVSVVAPVPYSPRLNLHKRWQEFASVPAAERLEGFELDHPRYIVVPKMGMATHGLSMFLGSFRRMLQRMRHTSCDVIDAHYVYPDGLAAIMFGAMFNKPVVVTARGSDINQFPEFKTIRPLVRMVLRRADALIAVSQSLKEVMVELGCPPEKITVIGNGVDSDKFQPIPHTAVREQLGLPLNRRILLSVGHLSERKGFEVLIEAMAQLCTSRSDLLLVIVGEGAYRAHLERKIADLGLYNKVRLVGACAHKDLIRWYNAADLFCLASSREGWPNVLLEAMACGKPVIATRVWGAPEIVVRPSLGMLVDRKPEAFRDAVEQALSREWDHDQIVAHARFNSWDKVAQRVVNVFRDVVERRNPSRVGAVSKQAGGWL